MPGNAGRERAASLSDGLCRRGVRGRDRTRGGGRAARRQETRTCGTRSSIAPSAGTHHDAAGVISGVPTSAGFFRFWIWNHDLTAAQGGPRGASEDRSEREFSIYVDPGLDIENESLKGATIGQAYSETLTAAQVDPEPADR